MLFIMMVFLNWIPPEEAGGLIAGQWKKQSSRMPMLMPIQVVLWFRLQHPSTMDSSRL